jgi:hypothetical protein
LPSSSSPGSSARSATTRKKKDSQLLSNAYNDFLKVVLANPDLHLRTNEPLSSPTPEQNERMLVIFRHAHLAVRARLPGGLQAAHGRDRGAALEQLGRLHERSGAAARTFHNALPLLLRARTPIPALHSPHRRGGARRQRPPRPFTEGGTSWPNPSSSSARPHPHGRLPGRLLRPVRARPRAAPHQGRRAARRHPRRRRRRSAVRQLPDGRPGPGPGAPGAFKGGPAQERRRRHAVQDVRLRHEGRACSRTTCCWPAPTRSWSRAAWRA